MMHVSDDDLDLDAVLPAQLHIAGAPETGERRLMRAVLSEALNCYRGAAKDPKFGREGRRREQKAAIAWFASDDARIYGFVGVCHALGLDPGAVRARLPRLALQRPRLVTRRVAPIRSNAPRKAAA